MIQSVKLKNVIVFLMIIQLAFFGAELFDLSSLKDPPQVYAQAKDETAAPAEDDNNFTEAGSALGARAGKGPDQGEGQTKKEPVTVPDLPPGINPESLRLIKMIKQKSKDLEEREQALLEKEKRLQEMDEKLLADLKKIEDALLRSQEQIGMTQALLEKNIKSLVKIYSSMRPEKAAPLLQALDESITVQIISKMKGKVAGQVMARLNTKVAKSISEKLAGKNAVTAKK